MSPISALLPRLRRELLIASFCRAEDSASDDSVRGTGEPQSLLLFLALRVLARLKLSLTSAVLLAMAGGVAFGLLAPEWARKVEFISDIFLRLIKSIIAPVIVGVLIRAIAGAGTMGALGRVGWKSVVYFEVSTTIALLLGWFTVMVVRSMGMLTRF